MDTDKTMPTEAKIKGENLNGEEREYTFILMTPFVGTKLFHIWAPTCIDIYRQLMTLAVNLKGDDLEEIVYSSQNILSVIGEVPKIIPWDVIEDWAEKMLAGHTVIINGETFTADETGFTTRGGDPLEVYCALVHAMMVNFPDYIGPFLDTLMGETESDHQSVLTSGSEKTSSDKTTNVQEK